MGALAAAVASVAATGWRGDGSGLYPDAKVVTSWAVDTHVLWATKLPSWSNSTPVVVGERVFTCSEPATLHCLDANTGAELWKAANGLAEVLPAEEQAGYRAFQQLLLDERDARAALDTGKNALKAKPDDADLTRARDDAQAKLTAVQTQLKPLGKYRLAGGHAEMGSTTQTPASDGTHVWALFGTGIAACYTMDGTRVWIAKLGNPAGSAWGFCASPILADGKLIVSFGDVFAFDPATGKVVWQAKSKPHYGTPVETNIAGVPVLVTPNGDIIRLADGKVMLTGMGDLEYNAPVVRDGVLYTVDRDKARAIKLPTELGEAPKAEVLWETTIPKNRYYASPVVANGLLFGITQSGLLMAFDTKTGEKLYEQRVGTGGLNYSALTVAGDALLVGADSGKTLIAGTGRTFAELGRGKLDGFKSTPAAVGARLYIRTAGSLFCLGEVAQ
jgi:outer membrane protein assembly factor BamB